MKYDTVKRVITFDSPTEQAEYVEHMAQFGPVIGKSHPDDCPYCKARGWETFPGTTFDEICDMIEASGEAEDAD